MNSTPNATEADGMLAARADERLAHAYEQIARADDQLARVTEQLSRLEHSTGRNPSAAPGRRASRGSAMLRGLTGLLLAAGIIVAAFVAQSSYGKPLKLMIARWAPQLISTPSAQAENASPSAQSAPPPVQVAAADPAAADATPAAQTAPQDAAPQAIAAPAAPSLAELAELLQLIARDVTNLQQAIDQLKTDQAQLKADQAQIAGDNARAVEQLKAGQDQMTRLIAKLSEQKASEPRVSQQTPRAPTPASATAPAPRPIAAPARKPVAAPLPQQARARPPAPMLPPDDQ
ncbi:hypothetical protein [Bradyrhizobium sp. STM 3562]|uniref:hypothetical protein n=1 Tax=Bradyrhizobium sp. STM 3562 TaxID=578924 RepID=UPI00388FAE5F